MSIPAEHKLAIITSGIDFMSSITKCYGADEGMKLWEVITANLDSSVKREIFFAMITGTHNDELSVSGIVDMRVSSIKTIREFTGLGLKDAKDISDRMQSGETVVLHLQDPARRPQAMRSLQELGHAC